MMKQNYIEKIKKMVEDGVIPRSAVSTVQVRHDDWCPIMRGAGNCLCDPEVTVPDIN